MERSSRAEERPDGPDAHGPRPVPAGSGRRRWLALAAAVLVAGGAALAALGGGGHRHGAALSAAGEGGGEPTGAPLLPPSTGTFVSDPIDSRFLTAVGFGTTSFWIQPWRAYFDTWPAARLLDSLGINFNVTAAQAQPVARLLHDSGFTLARIELGWGGLSYADPTRFVHEADVRARLTALRDWGLRPLILLNANAGAPCPAKKVVLETLAAAPAGARTIRLSAASAAQVVPGRTGFDASVFVPASRRHRHKHKKQSPGAIVPLTPAQRRIRHAQRRARREAEARAGLTTLVLQANPGVLITKVGADGVATLAKPLPTALAAGSYHGSTLLYEPFAAPSDSRGTPDPRFRATMDGWLRYVASVSRIAGQIFGAGGYDLEVWNELGFGSQFLDIRKYYAGSAEEAAGSAVKATAKAVQKALLKETLAYVRDPAHGISAAVGVSNGFASQSPFPSPAYSPPGLTAYSKHLYAGPKLYPEQFTARPGTVPRDALGRRDTAGPRGSAKAFSPLFVPSFQADLPEFSLTALSAETIARDLAPFRTHIYNAPHGRFAAAPGQPPPEFWMTEYNLGSASGVPVGPDGSTPVGRITLTAADRAHFEAKALLRSLVAMINKGMSREYFFAAAPGNLSLVGQGFFSALAAHPGSYPGDALGGETMTGFRNLLARFAGPGPGGPARRLRLVSIAQQGDHAQFRGDGTAAHPTLYDSAVLAVLPFQSSPTRFVIPVYVMTRDLLTLYDPAQAPGQVARFDLPQETFSISLAGLPAGVPRVSAYDPLRNVSTPARLVSQSGGRASIAIAATDYPRTLILEYPR